MDNLLRFAFESEHEKVDAFLRIGGAYAQDLVFAEFDATVSKAELPGAVRYPRMNDISM